MKDFSTKYMGKDLKNPLIVGSSGLTKNTDKLIKIQEYGAGAIVLKSMFEEQIMTDINALQKQDDMYGWYPEALDFINDIAKEQGAESYLDLIFKAKKELDIPVFASINCVTPGDWIKFSKSMEEAGADGIELNISIFPGDESISSLNIESYYSEIVEKVLKEVNIPVSVKLGANFTNYFNIADRLDKAGVKSLVLFNRYFQPDININTLEIEKGNYTSSTKEITNSLRWVALLSNKVNAEISATTGIHSYEGVVKQILAGADSVQIVSALYKNGIPYLRDIIADLDYWMERHNFNSIQEFKGLLRDKKENSAAFERMQYIKRSIES